MADTKAVLSRGLAGTDNSAAVVKYSLRAVLSRGLAGTDNCPICGRAMHKRTRTFLRTHIVVLICRGAMPIPHEVQIALPGDVTESAPTDGGQDRSGTSAPP